MFKKYLDFSIEWYEKNETKADLAFFVGGFIFDILTLSDIDDRLGLIQQIVYLFITAFILYYDFLVKYNLTKIPEKLAKVWFYRRPIFHFFLGSLLSVYSLFFLKSSSLFSSFIFVLILIVIMVGNELKAVQEREVNVKVGLHVLCLFCFFAILYPIFLGHVGWLPFLLALLTVGLLIFGVYWMVKKRKPDLTTIWPQFLLPSTSVLILITLLYFLGWIPPVPLSIQNMGVYHRVEKVGSQYYLYHEHASWKFWQKGDQDFVSQPGDKLYFFASIYSPAKFNDSVYLHWYFKDERRGWISTDRLPMSVIGGRREGFRGWSVKQNYSPGQWRVSVESTDHREIGRMYFEVSLTNSSTNRKFQREIQ